MVMVMAGSWRWSNGRWSTVNEAADWVETLPILAIDSGRSLQSSSNVAVRPDMEVVKMLWRAP